MNKKTKKILHLGQLIGGLEIYLRNTIIYSSKDFEFVIVKGDADSTIPIIKDGKAVKEYKVNLYRRLHPVNDIKCIFQVLRIIKTEKPDIIHCHSSKGGLIGRIVGFISGTKTLYTPHAFSYLSTQNKIVRKIYFLIEKYLKLNSFLLACSESERQLGITKIKYKKEKALVWSNSVPNINNAGIKDFPSLKDEKYISYIGRPSFQKNTFFLTDVVKGVVEKIPNFKIILLGVGFHSPDLKKLKELIILNNLQKNLILIDWLSHEDALSIIKNSHFYLSVSRYEGLPLAVVEAMSLGKPLVLSKVSGNIDCVDDNKNGYLIDLDKDLFAAKVIQLWDDSQRIKIFGDNSREKFLNQFNIKNQIKLLDDVYNC
jgi:glycosyltransferase involved in cell wall biosynthesis